MYVSVVTSFIAQEQDNKKLGQMQRNLCLLVALTMVYLTVESAPAGLGTLEFDKLDADLADLKYEVEEEDLDEFSKLLDEADDANEKNEAKTNVNTSGHKNSSASNKGSKHKHTIGDVKKFYKTAGVHDQGAYDDDEIYTQSKSYAGTAVGIKGKEDRKYRKGTKTRGFHRVHHKDEYKKDKVFYEDDETSGVINKVGLKGLGYKLKAGAEFNKGHFHHDRQKDAFGKRGYADKGFSDKKFSNYSDSQGVEESFSNES